MYKIAFAQKIMIISISIFQFSLFLSVIYSTTSLFLLSNIEHSASSVPDATIRPPQSITGINEIGWSAPPQNRGDGQEHSLFVRFSMFIRKLALQSRGAVFNDTLTKG